MAERLRTLMRWRGIRSQRQLSRLSGVPQTSIHRILSRGEAYIPSLSTVTRLARALGTTVPWLSEGDHIAPHGSQPLSSHESSHVSASYGPPHTSSHGSSPLASHGVPRPALLLHTPPASLHHAHSASSDNDVAELRMLMAQLSEAERYHIIALARLLVERTGRPITWRVGLGKRATRPPTSWQARDGL